MDTLPLPSWLIYCLIYIPIIAFFSWVVFFIIRRFIDVNVLKKHNDFAGFVIVTMGSLYSVFLGFTIVQTQGRYGEILAQVNKEAYLCADLYRITQAFPLAVKEEMHEAVKLYLKSVIEDEWPLMSEKKESPYTLKKLEEIWRPFYAFKPTSEAEKLWLAQGLQILIEFNNARLERIYSSWNSLGTLSWIALVFGAVILVSILFFLATENFRAQLSINILFVCYFTFMIYTVYLLDNPFRAPQKIEPKAYEVVFDYYEKTRGKLISPEEARNIKTRENP